MTHKLQFVTASLAAGMLATASLATAQGSGPTPQARQGSEHHRMMPGQGAELEAAE